MLESEYTLLDQQLLKKEYYKTTQKLYGWNDKNYWSVSKVKKDKLKAKKQLKALNNYQLDDVVKEIISWEKN